MPEVIASGNAHSVVGAELAAGLASLLDGGRYRRASEAALEDARRFSEARFRQSLLDIVREVG
jgi:hypothetical protein